MEADEINNKKLEVVSSNDNVRKINFNLNKIVITLL